MLRFRSTPRLCAALLFGFVLAIPGWAVDVKTGDGSKAVADSHDNDKLPSQIGLEGSVPSCLFLDYGNAVTDSEKFFRCFRNKINNQPGGNYSASYSLPNFRVLENLGGGSFGEVSGLCFGERDRDIRYTEIKTMDNNARTAKIRLFTVEPAGNGEVEVTLCDTASHCGPSSEDLAYRVSTSDAGGPLTAAELNSAVFDKINDLVEAYDLVVTVNAPQGSYIHIEGVTLVGLLSTDEALVDTEIALEPDSEPANDTYCDLIY